MIECCGCKKVLPEDSFYRRRAHKTRRNTRCKTCTAVSVKNWRENNPERQAHTMRKNIYGLSKDNFIEIYQTQDGKCGACKKDIPTYGRDISVDHNHDTGQVRGLLCHNCNDALGKLKDNPETVLSLYEYINKFQGGE